MFTANLLIYSVIAILLGSVISIELEYQSFSIDICTLNHSLAKRCNISSFGLIESQICRAKYLVNCSSSLIKDEDYILTLNKNGISYYCSFNFSKEPISLPKNMTLYQLEDFDCSWLSTLESFNFNQNLRYTNSHHEPDRRMQTSCNIRLNLNSTSNKSYLMHVMNQCTTLNSWLCIDTNMTNIININQNIPFSMLSSNSYLSAEYNLGSDIGRYTIEVLSLYQGGLRRELWGNKDFEGVPISTEFASLYSADEGFYISIKYTMRSPACRVIGYYKARYTAEANIQFYVNGTADAWLFNDNFEPNFPNIKSGQLYETKMNLIKDQLYYIRFDLNYTIVPSGLYNFNVTYPGIADNKVNLNDLFYPVRTDYSPLNLNILQCDTPYFLPDTETNGDILCPSENSNCSKLNYNKTIANNTWNYLCELYRWENNIQICEKCKANCWIYDNECICIEGYYLNMNTNSCESTYNYTATIRLEKKFLETSRKVMFIISNPCVSSQSWTCENTGVSDTLPSSIFKWAFEVFTVRYQASQDLNSYGKYSFQFNNLIPNMLQLTCWNQADFTGDVLFNKGQEFSNNYTYSSNYKSCRWEGFIRGIGGDIEFILSGNSYNKLWIKYDSTPAINYACCNKATYRIRMVKELFYYIRLDISDASSTLSANLTYKTQLPRGSETAIPINIMHQPIRLSMGILTGFPNITYTVDNNSPEFNLYYCHPICSSCIYSFKGYECTKCIADAQINNKRCICNANMLYNTDINKCEKYPSLSKNCEFVNDSMLCDKCVENASVIDYYCECEVGYYEHYTTDSCRSNPCRISFILHKTSQYTYSDTLLEINNPCISRNSILCEEYSSIKSLGTRKLIKFTDSFNYISAGFNIAGDVLYTISILNLKPGAFLLETFPSMDWTGDPALSTTALKFDLSGTNGKSYRLQGYLKISESRLYNFIITSNTTTRIHFDFLNEPWMIPESISRREYYLAANRYYYLRIDFLGVSSNSFSFNFVESKSDIESGMLYYADISTISRYNITSCDNRIYSVSYKNGLRYCPLLCSSCYIKINRSTTENNEECDACVEAAIVNSDQRCECKSEYYQEIDSDKCSKCPDKCITCGLVNGNVSCYSCITNAEVKEGYCECIMGYYLDTASDIRCNRCPDLCAECSLTNGQVICETCIEYGVLVSETCECKAGYYYDTVSSKECTKCPDTCKTCSYINGEVVCDSCIENAILDTKICKCKSGYILSASLPVTCYKIGEYCKYTQIIDNELACTSCITNAHLEGSRCLCNDTYYGIQSDQDECIQCPSPCRNCKKESDQIICETCIYEYYLSYINPGECLKCPKYCAECTEINGTPKCSTCMNMLMLYQNECTCQPGYGVDTSSITCKGCPDLSYMCEYNSNFITFIACKENTFNLENNCYCNRDYYSNTSCTPLNCRIDITLQNTSGLTLLDFVEDCNSNDKLICDSSYMRRTQVYKEDSIRLIKNRNYYLYSMRLDRGGLSYKYWNSSDIMDTPRVDRKEDLGYDLTEYEGGIVRYEGYVTFPYTGIIDFIIDTNTYINIYIQDDRNILTEYNTNEFRGFFTKGEYYFIRIELHIVPNSYISMIGYSYDLYFEISSDYLYYPTISSDSPIFIDYSKCVDSESSDPIDHEYGCPELCSKCEKSNVLSESPICSECYNSELSPQTMCRCRVGLYYNIQYDRCDDPYCSEYNIDKECVECFNNFLLSYGRCVCEGEDYEIKNDLCAPKEFRLKIDTHNNKIDLLFSKYLQYSLDKSDVTITIQNYNISELASYEFKAIIDKLSYSLEFKYPYSVDKEISIILSLSKRIKDRQGISLSTYIYYTTLHLLFGYSAPNISQGSTSTSITEEYSNTAIVSSAAVGSVTIGLSMINLNPNILLSMLTTLQLISFMPIMNITLPQKVQGICSGFETINIFPNIIEYFIAIEGKKINSRFTDYGYTTSLFLINSGEQISIFIEICIIYMILKILDKFVMSRIVDGRLKKVYSRIVSIFEYGMFVGFLIQGYLELFITSGLNVIYPEYNTSQQIISLVLASIVFTICIFLPVFLFLFLLKYADRFSEERFYKRFSVVLSFFDMSKEHCIQGIILITIRKMIFTFSILSLESSPYIQITINTAFSAGILAFYTINNTFKGKKDRYVEICIELLLFISFICLSLLLKDWFRGDILEWILVFILYNIMGVPFAVNVIVTVWKIMKYCREKYLSKIQIGRTASKSDISHAEHDQDNTFNQNLTNGTLIQRPKESESTLSMCNSAKFQDLANFKRYGDETFTIFLEEELSDQSPIQEISENTLNINSQTSSSQNLTTDIC